MKIFKLLGALLDYPDDAVLSDLRAATAGGTPAFVAGCNDGGALDGAQLVDLAAFIDGQLAADPMALQAEYVRTFDLRAEHSLHLTHHICGEEKTRGPALIDLSEFYKEHGLEIDPHELPDYLPAMLEFAAELQLDEARVFFADVGKILKVLADNLEESASPYARLVRMVESQGSLMRLAV